METTAQGVATSRLVESPATLVYASFHRVSGNDAGTTHTESAARALRRRGVDLQLLQSTRRPTPARWMEVGARAVNALDQHSTLLVRHHPAAIHLVSRARARGLDVVLEVNGPVEDFAAAHGRRGERVVRALGRMERACFRMATHVVAVTPSLLEYARDRGFRGRSLVLPNGADPDVFGLRVSAPDRTRSPYLAFCGTLAPWQGLDVVARAVQRPDWPRVEVRVVGKGRLAPTLDEVARHSPWLRREPPVQHHEVAEIVQNSLAVLSSNTRRGVHGSPVKVFEALMTGTPVIASDQPGQRDLVADNGIGLTYRHDDPADLTRAVTAMLDDHEGWQRMSSAAAAIRDRHTWDERMTVLLAWLAT